MKISKAGTKEKKFRRPYFLSGLPSPCVVGKLFGRVLIKRVKAGTGCAIREEQCGFRQGRGSMDQVFAGR